MHSFVGNLQLRGRTICFLWEMTLDAVLREVCTSLYRYILPTHLLHLRDLQVASYQGKSRLEALRLLGSCSDNV